MTKRGIHCLTVAILFRFMLLANVWAQEVAISYPGLMGESVSLWMAKEGGSFKENGIEAKFIYMEGGWLSIQSLLSGHTQFMVGDAVAALIVVAGGADIVLIASAKNILPYVFAVSKDIRRSLDLKWKNL